MRWGLDSHKRQHFLWCSFYRHLFPSQSIQESTTILVRSHKQAPYRYMCLSLLQLSQNDLFPLSIPSLQVLWAQTLLLCPYQDDPSPKGYFVVFPTPSDNGHIVLYDFFLQLGHSFGEYTSCSHRILQKLIFFISYSLDFYNINFHGLYQL